MTTTTITTLPRWLILSAALALLSPPLSGGPSLPWAVYAGPLPIPVPNSNSHGNNIAASPPVGGSTTTTPIPPQHGATVPLDEAMLLAETTFQNVDPNQTLPGFGRYTQSDHSIYRRAFAPLRFDRYPTTTNGSPVTYPLSDSYITLDKPGQELSGDYQGAV
ncbi:hypothetical protein H4R33_004004 [Dimargaris cristalligena]|uniref:Uncharacterized protein n=1 Tax=Dimargaris cristalligena TaxID=215637 RepID=A0A4P9ZUZ9_9FUNG|nr:hypothetical protein H4R33_004004 [Dimargaris cristalligena]RKP37436.1 hypothetical protein BJ085DRAFT_39826 [Dimargaris cristalligena]|eukprot:RKP37436.1 hypothetical protein BJ085DRAFT_39826 [Dimargaris cristalligena]